MDSNALDNVTVGPTEYTGQILWSPALAIIMAIIASVGTAGNLLIIGSVFLERRLRVRGNAFIVNLAVADLLVTAYVMPIGIATSQYRLKPFSDELCEFNAFMFITTCGVSTQSLMLIAFERYIHVCKLSYYGKIFRPKLVALYIAIAWLYTMAWAAQGWTGWTHYEYGHDYYLCLFYGPASMSYSVCLSIFGVILPITVLIFCYVNIFRTVKNSKLALETHGTNTPSFEAKMRKKQLREHQFIFMLFIIVSVFCVCWAPGGCVMTLSGVLGPDGLPPLAYTITIWIAICNSAMNSAIYGIMNNNFRRGYAHIVSKIFCCFCSPQGVQCSSSCDGKSAKSARNDDTYKSYLSSGKATDTATEFSTLPMSQGGFSKRAKSDLSSIADKNSKTSKDSKTKTESLAKGSDTRSGAHKPNEKGTLNNSKESNKSKENPIPKSSHHVKEKELRLKNKAQEKTPKDTNNNFPNTDNRSEKPQSESRRSRKEHDSADNKHSKHRHGTASSDSKPVKTSDTKHAKSNPVSSNVKGNWEKSDHSRSRPRSKSAHNKDSSNPEKKPTKSTRSKSSSNVKKNWTSDGKHSAHCPRSHSSEGHRKHSSEGHKSRSRSDSKPKCHHKNHSSKTCSHHARSHSKSSERKIESHGDQPKPATAPKPTTRDAQVEAKPNSNIVTLTLTADV